MRLAKLSAVAMFIAAFSSMAFAGISPAPELDPSIASSALLLVGGAVLVLRRHLKK
jgi:hypothetical protein